MRKVDLQDGGWFLKFSSGIIIKIKQNIMKDILLNDFDLNVINTFVLTARA